MIEEMLKYNEEFVARREYEQFQTSKYPDKKIAIVTCMDTRLVQLLPAALGIKNGDVKIIKNAGGTITNPFDSTVRSLLVAIYELGVKEIMIIGHHLRFSLYHNITFPKWPSIKWLAAVLLLIR